MEHDENVDADGVLDCISRQLDSLTGQQRVRLHDEMSILHFKRNELIYKEQDRPYNIMCLIRGKVKIFKDGIGGRNPIIRAIKPVEFIGYRAFFAHERYKTSAMAFENSVIASFPSTIIDTLVRQNSGVAMYFLRHLSRLLGTSDDSIVNLTQKHVRGRLAETILSLRDNYGVEEDGHTLNIQMSREDLASLSNMTTSNAIRTLSSFASEKLISIDGKKIKVIDDKELDDISNQGMNLR